MDRRVACVLAIHDPAHGTIAQRHHGRGAQPDQRGGFRIKRHEPAIAMHQSLIVRHRCHQAARAAQASKPLGNGNPRIKGNPTQRDLGQLIGASRQKVNFHLGQWQAEGIIARQGNAFAIQNWKALQAIAGSEAD